MPVTPTQRWTGAAAIALAILFNIPYAILAATYDYPDVLRGPPGQALDLFAAGGAALVLTWHGFALAALALAPLAVALAITPSRLERSPRLALGAAIFGVLAGFSQAMGLWRWVFVVPGLARDHAAAGASEEVRIATEHSFSLLNQYGGVAIGEHLGQLLTALFVVLLSRLQGLERRRMTAFVGYASAAAIAIGTTEGVAMAIGRSGEMFGIATIVGFLGLTVWLLMTGIGLMKGAGQPV